MARYTKEMFANGFSTPNGVHDNVNNVERIKIAPSSALPAGKWQMTPSNSGGLEQAYAVVVAGRFNRFESRFICFRWFNFPIFTITLGQRFDNR